LALHHRNGVGIIISVDNDDPILPAFQKQMPTILVVTQYNVKDEVNIAQWRTMKTLGNSSIWDNNKLSPDEFHHSNDLCLDFDVHDNRLKYQRACSMQLIPIRDLCNS
jgi:hypothetical protein